MRASTQSYPGSDTYLPGGAWFICDRCSGRFRRTDMKIEWTNLRVDAKCLDPRPPQMSVPNVFPEGLPFPDSRSPQDRSDRLEDDTSLQSVQGGFAVQNGVTYPNGQVQQPGALSPQPLIEDNAPVGPNTVADDITFITGPVSAPQNPTYAPIDPVPAPRPSP